MLAAVRLLVLSVWIGLVPACCGYVQWIYPGDGVNNLTFNYIDIVYFTWASSVDKPCMILWCAPTPTEPQSKGYSKSCAPDYAAYKNLNRPQNGGLKKCDESLHCIIRNSILRASANQRLQPSILPVQRLQAKWCVPHASRKLLGGPRLCQYEPLLYYIQRQRWTNDLGHCCPG